MSAKTRTETEKRSGKRNRLIFKIYNKKKLNKIISYDYKVVSYTNDGIT